MITSLAIFNKKGNLLIWKIFKDGINKEDFHLFSKLYIITKKYAENPIIFHNGISYIHTACSNIILVIATNSNVNAAMMFEFLYNMVSVLKQYFMILDENKILKHITFIYEFLDEVIDYGVPQDMHFDRITKILQEFHYKEHTQGRIGYLRQIDYKIIDINYQKNEFFLDMYEKIYLAVSSNGNILDSYIDGKIICTAKLSQTPCIVIIFNNDTFLEDYWNENAKKSSLNEICISQFVKIPSKEKYQFKFIPPDGKFQLLQYRIRESFDLPFHIIPCINEENGNKIQLTLKLKSLYEAKLFAAYILIKIRCPKNTIKITPYISGKEEFLYQPEKSQVIWKIKNYPGLSDSLLRCEIQMSSEIRNIWIYKDIGISLEFCIPMYTASRIKVRSLKIYENYKSEKYVRYLLENGDYKFNIC